LTRSKIKASTEPKQGYKYKLKFVPSALKEWQGLDNSVKEPMRKALKKRLDNPHVPGCELHGNLEGFYKIKLLKQGYRLVYYVEDEYLVVVVMAVDKREDSVVYRSAVARVAERVGALVNEVAKKSKPWDSAVASSGFLG
jgi:mRNA interferase RelE/StbE